MKRIQLAFSPCPNDTFIFDAMVHRKIDTEDIEFDYSMADVEALNDRCFRHQPDMSKLSYHAWLHLASRYQLLNSGSALGFGNGPMVIAKELFPVGELKNKMVAIPGEYTTAHLLLKFMEPLVILKKIMVFHEIETAVLTGEVDAGVIIHENRFTYQQKGLVRICDLGEFWEKETGCPIPLGGIVVKKELGNETIAKLERIMHRSVAYAMQNPAAPMEFVRANAREMEEEVMLKHIHLYVNQYTLDLGEAGHRAIRKLQELFPPLSKPV
jgi:1,4-dihydroxy-6-naphthoate synthase